MPKQKNYPVPPEELAKAIQRAKRLGRLTDELARLALSVAKIHFCKHRYRDVSSCDKDDLLGDYGLALAKHWEKLDAAKNPYSYLVTMAQNCGRMSSRGAYRRLRKISAKAEHDFIKENARVNQYIRAHEGRLNNGG